MSDTLTAEKREKTGSRASIKLRAAGSVPAVLYGHKEPPVSLAIDERELRKALAHKAKVINLQGEADGQAVVQALQWDTFHRDLLHVDLLRVDAGERVHVTVPMEIKGDAPGVNEGGVVSVVVDHIELEAAPASIPEVVHVDVSDLHLGGNLHASELIDLPKGAKLLTAPETVLVHCVQPAGAPKLDSVAEEAGSPEVIGEKKDEE